VSRGRADASLRWGDESDERAARFEATALPAARGLDPERLAVVATSEVAPEANPEREAAGLTPPGASAGRAAWSRRLAPRHREAVRAYFSGPLRREGAPEGGGDEKK